jgi:hypothetical protein
MGIDALIAAAPAIGDFLGIGGAAAAPAAAGIGEAAAGTGIADIVGTGAGLAGGTTGLEGTLLAGGSGLGVADLAAGTAGLGAAGTAADFLAAPGATGLAAGATTPIGGAAADAAAAQAASTGQASGIADLVPGGGPGALGAAVPTPQPTALGGVTSATNLSGTGTALPGGSTGLTGTSGVGATPSAIPSGSGGAAGIAGPAGASPVDATSSASIPGAEGPTSLNGAPLNAAPPSSIDQLLQKAGNSITSNPLGIALGAAGLGYNIYSGQKNTANQKALTADANAATANSNQMVASGEALQQYLTNGTLPPAYQQQVDQAIADAKTSAISNAAQQGQNTDPTQNTALAATLAKIDASRAGMQTQVATQLFSSGTSLVQSGATAAGLSGQLFQALVANDTTQAANTGKAIATLAAALNGKSQNSAGGITISTGG